MTEWTDPIDCIHMMMVWNISPRGDKNHTHDDPSMTGGMVEGENGEVTWQETPNPEDTTGN